MVVDPALRIVTVLPEIVAFEISELEYVNVPELFEDGSVRLNEGSPYIFDIRVKLCNDGSRGVMVKTAVITADA
jgi:hypothetical protein